MEVQLKNYMEDIVSDKVDTVMHQTGCCMCDICRMDVTAIALNNLKPYYVVTAEGSVYARTSELALQSSTDVISAVAKGADIVKNHPRHVVV